MNCRMIVSGVVILALAPISFSWDEMATSRCLASTTLAEQQQERTSDIWLKSRLATTYLLNEHLSPFQLEVEVKDGVAYLSGTVDSEVEKELAVTIAEGVEGIHEVKDSIQVNREAAARPAEPADEDSEFVRMVKDVTLTARVKSRLLWNRQTSGLKIEVDAKNSVVTLRGVVRSGTESDLAEQLTRNTSGVGSVINELRVQPALQGESEKGLGQKARQEVGDAWITTKVKSMLLYNKGMDSLDVEVSTQDGVVTLEGKVADAVQKQDVLDLVRQVVGVKEVKDRLTVEGPVKA